jgi:hypothetical protein
MNALRPAVHALLALALAVQGLAFASASHGPMTAAADTAVAMQDQAADMSDMPCHGGDEAPAAPSLCDCCDGDCTGMSGCAFGQVVAIAPSARLPFTPAADAAIAARDAPADSVTLPSHLRPPIAHA